MKKSDERFDSMTGFVLGLILLITIVVLATIVFINKKSVFEFLKN